MSTRLLAKRKKVDTWGATSKRSKSVVASARCESSEALVALANDDSAGSQYTTELSMTSLELASVDAMSAMSSRTSGTSRRGYGIVTVTTKLSPPQTRDSVARYGMT